MRPKVQRMRRAAARIICSLLERGVATYQLQDSLDLTEEVRDGLGATEGQGEDKGGVAQAHSVPHRQLDTGTSVGSAAV